jgi:hypothetical protein
MITRRRMEEEAAEEITSMIVPPLGTEMRK